MPQVAGCSRAHDGKLPRETSTPTRYVETSATIAKKHSHLEIESDERQHQQPDPDEGRSVKTDPEQLVVGTVNLAHILQRLEHPFRRTVFLDIAPPS